LGHQITRASTLVLAALLLTPVPTDAQPYENLPPQEEQINPARLEAARTTVGHVFPEGTYARIMKRTFDSTMNMVTDSIGKMPLRDLAAISGKSVGELEAMDDSTLEEMMAILDPAFEERMRLVFDVMSKEMAKLMTRFEPSFRDGLVNAYARRFTTDELVEMNGFFATPTGQTYAAESMIIMTDPEVMAKIQEFMPVMMQEMPNWTAKLMEASSDLPSPRKPEELNDTEKARLAELLGVPVEEIARQAD